METKEIFARRIVELRTEKGLGQSQLAALVGVSKTSANLYESASRVPDIQVLGRYAKVLEVTSDYLLGLSDNRTADAAAIGDRTGLNDDAIECLELYARCREFFKRITEDDALHIGHLTGIYVDSRPEDIKEKEFCNMYGELYSAIKSLSVTSFQSDLGEIFYTLKDYTPYIYRAINYILRDINFLSSLGLYLFAKKGTGEIPDSLDRIDDLMDATLAFAYADKIGFFDPDFLERNRLLYLQDTLKAMREEIIKQQEETNAKENKRQE